MTEQDMIQEALGEYFKLNTTPNKWATFEAERFPNESRCIIRWGTKHTDGTIERCIQTITWTLYNGRCAEVRLTHS